jgi:hypothetical protein
MSEKTKEEWITIIQEAQDQVNQLITNARADGQTIVVSSYTDAPKIMDALLLLQVM